MLIDLDGIEQHGLNPDAWGIEFNLEVSKFGLFGNNLVEHRPSAPANPIDGSKFVNPIDYRPLHAYRGCFNKMKNPFPFFLHQKNLLPLAHISISSSSFGFSLR